MSDTAIVQYEQAPLKELEPQELSCDEVIRQVKTIQRVMESVMKQNEHYGIIPGCKKPSLWKPGAEKLSLTFRLAPRFDGERTPLDLGNHHREYVIKCEIYHITSGRFLGSGVGSCSTMEGKYRYRGNEKIWTGTPVPKEYWNLRNSGEPEKMEQAKKLIGGKGFSTAKNENGGWEIVMQGDKQEHDNPADFYNTVLKMAKKRAHVDAILTVTAASDCFTQDVEDLPDSPPPVPAIKVPQSVSAQSIQDRADTGAAASLDATTAPIQSSPARNEPPAGDNGESRQGSPAPQDKKPKPKLTAWQVDFYQKMAVLKKADEPKYRARLRAAGYDKANLVPTLEESQRVYAAMVFSEPFTAEENAALDAQLAEDDDILF